MIFNITADGLLLDRIRHILPCFAKQTWRIKRERNCKNNKDHAYPLYPFEYNHFAIKIVVVSPLFLTQQRFGRLSTSEMSSINCNPTPPF